MLDIIPKYTVFSKRSFSYSGGQKLFISLEDFSKEKYNQHFGFIAYNLSDSYIDRTYKNYNLSIIGILNESDITVPTHCTFQTKRYRIGKMYKREMINGGLYPNIYILNKIICFSNLKKKFKTTNNRYVIFEMFDISNNKLEIFCPGYYNSRFRVIR